MPPPQPQSYVTAYTIHLASDVPIVDTCPAQGNVS